MRPIKGCRVKNNIRAVTKEVPEGHKKMLPTVRFFIADSRERSFYIVFSYVSRLFTFKEGFIGEVAAVGIGLGDDF